MNEKIAVIDLGTNSLILTIAEKSEDGFIVIEELYQIIQLGEGITKIGNISQNAISRCIHGFENINKKIKKYNISKVNCVATSALRDANNGGKIITTLQDRFQIAINVISGHEEAKLVTQATIREFDIRLNKTLIFDIGGGSCEFIFLENVKIKFCESLQIGAVRCTEEFFHSNPVLNTEILKLENHIKKTLDKLPLGQFEKAIGIAGTVTTLSSINCELEVYQPEIIHQSEIDLYSIIKIKHQFQKLDLENRKKIKGLDSKRAEIILAGTIICEQIMKKYKLEKIQVSDRGLRWGLLYQQIN